MNITLIDIEIRNCIPEKGVELEQGLTYSRGWTDYEGMGIAVVGVYAPWFWAEPVTGIWDEAVTPPEEIEFQKKSLTGFVKTWDSIITGYNVRAFDKPLLAAHGVELPVHYDILEEIRLTAYGSTRWQDTPKGHSYTLNKVAAANGFKGHAKTGSGATSPVLWQRGERQAVIDDLMSDLKIMYELLQMGLKGELIDPNTGKLLKLRGLE